jgi:hypothetical protein
MLKRFVISGVAGILMAAIFFMAGGCVSPRGPKLPGVKRLPPPPRVHAPHGLPLPPPLPLP